MGSPGPPERGCGVAVIGSDFSGVILGAVCIIDAETGVDARETQEETLGPGGGAGQVEVRSWRILSGS